MDLIDFLKTLEQEPEINSTATEEDLSNDWNIEECKVNLDANSNNIYSSKKELEIYDSVADPPDAPKNDRTEQLPEETAATSQRHCSNCQTNFTTVYTMDEHIAQDHPKLLADYAIETYCHFCEITLSSRKHLDQHLYVHRKAGLLIARHGMQNETNWECKKKCGYTTKYKSNLVRHMKGHGEQTLFKSFKCAVCGKSYSSKNYFQMHKKIHTGEKPFKCTECDYSSSSKHGLRIHNMEMHTAERPHKCNLCDYSCITKGHLNEHIRSHSDERSFKCHMCYKVYKVKKDLTRHLKTHAVGGPYKCNMCDFSSKQQSSLNQHMLLHTEQPKGHGEQTLFKSFKCAVCGKSYSSKNYFQMHKKIHTGEKPFKCTECDYSSSSKHGLRIHNMEMHTAERPHKCNLCDYSCITKGHLNEHIRSHSDERSFKCHMCYKAYKVKKDLTQHLKTHTVGGPYKCNMCDFSSKQQSSLNQHMLLHTEHSKIDDKLTEYLAGHMEMQVEDNPFKCNLCEYRTSSTEILTNHVNDVHIGKFSIDSIIQVEPDILSFFN